MTTRALMIVLALGLVVPFHAFAQDEGDEEGANEDEGSGGGDEGEASSEDENAAASDDESAGGDEDKGDEKTAEAAPKGPRSWFFGPFGRYVIVPAFMLELFLEQAPTLGNGSVGIIADHRSADGPTLEIGLGYTGYVFDGPFQAKGDPETDTEWLESNLGLIHLTGSVLWHSDIASKLSFEYGVGLDLGIMTGEMKRTEAYKAGGAFHKCAGFDFTSAYCEPPTNMVAGTDAYDEEGAHYNVVEKRVPPIGGGFMLPHLALRWEPIPELAAKVEFAYGIVQLWFGLSVAYAPNI
jgi:hypothetical protein